MSYLIHRTCYTKSVIPSDLDIFSFENFAHWLSGFIDAEGLFYISISGYSVSFRFQLKLHIDDLQVLLNISKRLEAGTIHKGKNDATLVLSSKEDILKIFHVLDIKPLNTTKYLNFLSFKEAFFLYINRDKKISLSKNLTLTPALVPRLGQGLKK